MTIPLHEPQITQADIDVVTDALRSQWVSTGGPFIDQFERELADFAGFSSGVAVCNGTAGLVLAIEVLKRQQSVSNGFCALVPTLSFAATWNSVIQAGGLPVPVDCAPGFVNISAKTLLDTIHSQFKRSGSQLVHVVSGKPLLCAIPAHILGWAYDMQEIRQLCLDLNVGLIEDAAESLGTRYHSGEHVGMHGVCAVVSFNGNKILTTGGGGMLLTNDMEFARRAKHLSTTAKSDFLRFVHDEPGFNFRMVNVLAALGVSQLRRLPENLSRKRAITKRYEDCLYGTPVKLYLQDNCQANNWINTVMVPSMSVRDRVLNELRRAGFDCRPLWTPFHRLPYCSPDLANPEHFSNAELMWKTMISLPSSPQLPLETVELVCRRLVAL